MHERGCVPGVVLGASCTPAALSIPSSPLRSACNPRPPKPPSACHLVHLVHSASRTRRPSLNANATKQLWHCVAHIALQACKGTAVRVTLQPAYSAPTLYYYIALMLRITTCMCLTYACPSFVTHQPLLRSGYTNNQT